MLRATQTFHAFTAKGMRTVAAGTELTADDALVQGREHLFAPVNEPRSEAEDAPQDRPEAEGQGC